VRVLVWRRADFRETSRLVTLVSREQGRFTALAKGAHRPGSAQLGRLDFLNLCDVTLAGKGIPLLGRTRLVHEPRALREPHRFLAAMHIAELFDRALLADRADPELFDVLLGAVTMLERSPTPALPTVVLGLELRLLRALGLVADLGSCVVCGADAPRHPLGSGAGLACGLHREADGPATLSPAAAGWLRTLTDQPARTWTSLRVERGLGEALLCAGRWVEAALEQRPRHRRAALERLGRADAARPA
jgi:DNA repair protein RecO (recombination protein O)